MLDKIPFRFPLFSRQSIHDSEELTSLELVGRTAHKVNELVEHYNQYDETIAKKEDSSSITSNRKLSANGNFTGLLAGNTVSSVLANIKDSLTLAKSIIDMVNSRESIGTIYDGGTFIETDPPTHSIEGGLF